MSEILTFEGKKEEPQVEQRTACPMATAPAMDKFSGQIRIVFSDCLEEKCSWWHSQAKHCAVRMLATGILGVKDSLGKQN